MTTVRDAYKYRVKRQGKIIYRGTTADLGRAARDHKARYPDCRVEQVGRRTTWTQAQRWKRELERMDW